MQQVPSKLDLYHFGLFIKGIAKDISQNDIKTLFSYIDKNHDGMVDQKEALDAFVYGISGLDKNFSPISERVEKLIVQFRKIVKNRNADLKKIFSNFDKSGDQVLNLEEFSKILLVIDKNLPMSEIQAVFHVYDKNNDQTIDFEEFKAMMEG